MATGDAYLAKLVEAWGAGGETMLNNFTFVATGTGGSASDLAAALNDDAGLGRKILDTQAAHVAPERWEVFNLFDLSDFSSAAITLDPKYSGEALPAHSAVNYTLQRNTRAVRPGHKRFSGIPETAQVDGLITLEGYITDINALCGALAEDINGADSAFYTPVVLKRIAVPVDEAHPNGGYRLPANVGELVYGTVTVVTVNLRVSHQVSRGNGR